MDDPQDNKYNNSSMTLNNSRFRNFIIGVLLLVLGGVVGYRLQPKTDSQSKLPVFELKNTNQPQEYKEVDFKQFWEVWAILKKDYLDQEKLNDDKMVQGAIGGMTSALEDPYTLYLPPEEQKRSVEDLQGSFFGVGIQLGYIDNTVAVIAPIKGGPAAAKGVMAGDLILHVKDAAKGLDKDTTGWSLNEAVNNIRGDKGTEVTLTLFRKDNGNQPFEVIIARDEIVVPTVELTYAEKNSHKVAHIVLSRFGEKTTPELEKIISDILINRPKIDGIVLDLRNNPGGFFDGAIEIASEFIEEGVVVSQKSKTQQQDYKALGNARLANIPIMVLINRGSASASEIVAGALKDRKGAKLIGERSFGKGTVQDARQLDNGAGLHVTIARWLLPSGAWIHDEGIPVDVEVKDDPNTPEDEVVLKAIEEFAAQK